MSELFEPKNEHPYHPRDVSQFITPSVYTVHHCTKSISFLRPQNVESFAKQAQGYWKLERF